MRGSGFLTISLMFMLTACAGIDQPRAPAARAAAADVEPWQGEMPYRDPWLRDQMPEGAMAYVRIPHPIATLAIPKGNMLDAALGSEANIANVIEIQQRLVQMLTEAAGPEAGPALKLLVDELRSPIEVTGSAMPVPWVMVGLTLDIDSSAELESLLNQISQTTPLPPLLAPLDDAGYAQFRFDQPVFVNFDASSGRLALFGGYGVSRDTFETVLGAPQTETPHPMASLESGIDSSGQGYFVWVDTSVALDMLPLFAPADTIEMLRATGADQMRALAMGIGVADGKGRMKLVADLGSDRSRRPFPVIENRIGATSVGDPRSMFLFSIPGPDEFARLEQLFLSYLPAEAASGWTDAKLAIVNRIGVSIEELLAAIGPELITFSDAAGDFSGFRVRDSALLGGVLDRLAASAGEPIGERNVGGQTIRHVSLPGDLGMPDASELGEAAAVLDIIGRIRSRMYWVEDGEYLYMASLPQMLMDRASLGPDTSIADWLTDTQHVDFSSTLLGATGSVANVPRLTYQIYVMFMQSLADLVGADYDVWSMPTPVQLGLPERGTLGLSVNLGEPQVSLELIYESHPAEVLLTGGGMAGVAAAGVMAAIALPAYRDYTIRAQVSEGLNLASLPKAAVAETWYASGAAPADLAAAGLDPEPSALSGRYVQGIDIVEGQILVVYGGQSHPLLAARTLVLTPYQVGPNRDVVWVCGYAAPPPGARPVGATGAGTTDVQQQYLPSACRSGAPARIADPAPLAAVF